MSPQQRRIIIKENIFKTDYQGLAQLCGVTKRTIIRDINRWRQDGGFEESLMDEFVATYPNMKDEFPEKAFDRLCYLLGRTLTRKIEAKTEHRDVKVDVKRLEIVQLMETYGEAVEAAVRRNIQSLTKDADKQQMDTPHAHAKAS